MSRRNPRLRRHLIPAAGQAAASARLRQVKSATSWVTLWCLGAALAIFGVSTMTALRSHGQEQLTATSDPPQPISLAGTWYVSGGSGGASGSTGPRQVQLPSSWHDLQLDGSTHGPMTFYRRWRIPAAWQEQAAAGRLGLLVDAVRYASYEVTLGGVEVGRWDAGEYVPTPRPRVFKLPASAIGADGTLRLALRLERSSWAYGGSGQARGPVGRHILLGDVSDLQRRAKLLTLEQKRRGSLPLVLISLASLLGLYHFALAIRYRRLSSDFILGCITWVGWIFVFVNERGEIIFETHDSLRQALVCLSHLIMVLIIELFWRLLERPLSRWLRLYQASHLLISISALWIPAAWLSASLPWRLIYILPVAGYATYAMAREARTRPAEEQLWRWTALPLCLLIDLGLQGYGFDGRFIASNAAVLGVGVISALGASRRFHRVHSELEQLSQHLEIEVDEQTEELASTNRRLHQQIAERHLVEGALRMLERAVEQSADGIAVTDLSGSTKFLNEAWAVMHGHDVYDVLGYEIGLFHTSEQMQDEVFPLMTQVRQVGSFQGEVGHRRKDGSTFLTWMSVTRLQSDDSEAVGMVAIARDITGQRQAAQEQLKLEKEAQQAEKLESLAILASGIAHDFNNLLTSVLGHASLLARQLPEGTTDHDRALQIESAADRAARLSDQLLSYAGEDQMAPVAQPINGVIDNLTPELESLVPQQVTLQFQLKRDLLPVKVDQGQVHQVLLQLVENGLEALDDDLGGVITVRTSSVEASREYFEGAFCDAGRTPGTYVFFEVSDSGRGIESETLAHIFDPFFTTKSGGRGLGLASCLGIVRAHGGAIKVYSQPGRGSTFEVLFPAVEEVELAVSDEREVRSWQGGGTVLVVDDEELVREVAKDILEAQGFEVLTAEDGRQAVRMFRKRRFDIRAVLLDLTMPQMDGEQAFRAMKMAEPSARVFLMSGYSQQQIRQRLEGEGIDGFLHKPFRPEDLLRLLRGVLDPPA